MLGAERRRAGRPSLLGVDSAGTFEHGTSVLQLRTDPDDPARWGAARARLRAARDDRPQPGLDDKVVSAWNGLAVAALAEAGALLGEPSWVAAAEACADLLVSVHLDDTGRLVRVSRGGVAGSHAGVLEDYACVAEAFLVLHQVSGEAAWLQLADQVLGVVVRHFGDDATGGFFDTPDDGERLVLRPQDPTDNATPSGWSVVAGALLSYAALSGSEPHRAAAERALGALSGALPARFAGWSLAVLEAWLDGPREVAVVGPDDDARDALRRTALRATAPGLVLSVGEPDAPEVPLLAGRPLVAGVAGAYVCRRFVCDAPVTDPAELADLLR